MTALPARAIRVVLTALAVASVAPAATAGAGPELCGFFRGQAHGKAIDHYATEALWACEAVAVRREAGMRLSDRLLAVEYALERFRDALLEERSSRYARTSGPGVRPSEARERAGDLLAEETGMLEALEAVRTGF